MSTELWDWRRRVGGLYAAVRAAEPVAGWRLWRAERDRLFREHPQSPIEDRAGFSALPFFDYDPALRFTVGLRAAEGSAFMVPVGGDGTIGLRPFARTEGLGALGGELTLYWIEGYGGGVFLPFTDATSGRESYGAGRYLLDTIKGADLGETGGRTVLDFNFSYNPSCSYSDRYVCPLAPLENRLPARVTAGERRMGPIGAMLALVLLMSGGVSRVAWAAGNSGAPDPELRIEGLRTFGSEQQAKAGCGSDVVVWADRYAGYLYFRREAEYGRTGQGAFACLKQAEGAHYWSTGPMSSIAGGHGPGRTFEFPPAPGS